MSLPPTTTTKSKSKSFLTQIFDSLAQQQRQPQRPPPTLKTTTTTTTTPLNPTLPPNPLLAATTTNQVPNQQLKPLLTTLHLLFPSELLPALDLLDRGLVSRFTTAQVAAAAAASVRAGVEADRLQSRHDGCGVLYVVRSSAAAGAGANAGRNQQDSPGRRVGGVGAAAAATMSYEVRLGAWNCSCPAFAFEGVGLMGGGSEVWEGVVEERRDRGVGQDEGWVFGGLRNLGCGGGDDEDERKFPVCKHLLACLLVEKCSLFGDGVVIKTVSDEEMAGWAAGWGD